VTSLPFITANSILEGKTFYNIHIQDLHFSISLCLVPSDLLDFCARSLAKEEERENILKYIHMSLCDFFVGRHEFFLGRNFGPSSK
jgi:hypothetical protein